MVVKQLSYQFSPLIFFTDFLWIWEENTSVPWFLLSDFRNYVFFRKLGPENSLLRQNSWMVHWPSQNEFYERLNIVFFKNSWVPFLVHFLILALKKFEIFRIIQCKRVFNTIYDVQKLHCVWLLVKDIKKYATCIFMLSWWIC